MRSQLLYDIIIRAIKPSKKVELFDKIEKNVFKLKLDLKQAKITDYYTKNTLN